MFLLTKVIKSECCKTAQLKAKVYKRFFLVFEQSKEKRGGEFPLKCSFSARMNHKNTIGKLHLH